MRNLLLLSFLTLLFFSCTKETVIENVIIDDNSAPHYDEVTTVQIQNYVNKIYIDLLGREPLESELNTATSNLKLNSLSDASRDALLVGLMNSDEYFKRFYDIYQVSYLPGANRDELDFRIYIYEVERDNALQAGNNEFVQYFDMVLGQLYALRNLQTDYQNGNVNINEFMQIICTNDMYDEINMGAENFVLACFENFLKRTPTDAELASGVDMVNSDPAQLFFQDGNSKINFIQIITTIPEFYQGLAVDIYNQLLVRLPNSEEMADVIFMFDETKDYAAVQRLVMKSDEYAGF